MYLFVDFSFSFCSVQLCLCQFIENSFPLFFSNNKVISKAYDMNLFSVAVIIDDEVWNISNEPKMPRATNSSVGIFFWS